MKPRKSVYLYLSVLLFVVMIGSACTPKDPVYTEVTTRISDMATSDVFDMLPTADKSPEIYNSPDEISGEYLELASVELKESVLSSDSDRALNKLKEEAALLGSNGLLILDDDHQHEGNEPVEGHTIKAIAIYTLNGSPSLGNIAAS